MFGEPMFIRVGRELSLIAAGKSYAGGSEAALSDQKSQVTRNNHYVPQMYLRHWSTNGNTVLDYRLLVHYKGEETWKRSSIRSTCSWQDFYSQHLPDGIDDSVETYFSQRYETPAAPVFQKVEADASLSANEMRILVEYLVAQLFRTPSAMIRHTSLLRREFAPTAEAAVNRGVSALRLKGLGFAYPSADEGAVQAPFPNIPIHSRLDEERLEIVVSTSCGRQGFLASIGSILGGAVPRVLLSYPWVILKTPRGAELPTSDDPVVVFRVEAGDKVVIGGGMGVQYTNIMLPLDPRHVLFTEVGMDFYQLAALKMDRRLFDIMFEAIIKNAFLHVFSRSSIDDIGSYRPRRVDPERRGSLKNMIAKWDEVQWAIENDYL